MVVDVSLGRLLPLALLLLLAPALLPTIDPVGPDLALAAERAARPGGTGKTSRQGAPRYGVPPAAGLLILIRTSLIALDHANKTGNYTVLRDIAAPAFHNMNSAARLAAIFSRVRAVDLSAVAAATPELERPPAVDATGRLRLVGHFATGPARVRFHLVFQAVAGRWRLYGLSVSPRRARVSAASPQHRSKRKATKPRKSKKRTRRKRKRPAIGGWQTQ